MVQEIPSFHAMPLTPKCDGWCEFPVADRPNAVRQFFSAAAKDPSMIKAPWILMIETDYVWMGPLVNVPRAETNAKSWGFPYGYIVPTHPCALLLLHVPCTTLLLCWFLGLLLSLIHISEPTRPY